MKLLSPILLGLGLLSAAMASDDANHLRANTSARQLSSDSSENGGGTLMWYLLLNGLNLVEDFHGGPGSCGCQPDLPRCGPPHIHGPCSSHSGGSGGGDSGGGDDSGGQPTSESSSAVDGSYSGNDNESNEENYDDNENTSAFSSPPLEHCGGRLSDEDHMELLELTDTKTFVSYEDTPARMRRIAEIFSEAKDRRGLFPSVSVMITEESVQTTSEGHYQHQDLAEQLVEVLFRRYFDAFHGYLQGQEIEPQWQEYFRLAQVCSNSPLYVLGTGVNTHLTYDLPLTLLHIGAEADFKDDFMKFGDVLVKQTQKSTDLLESQQGVDAYGFFNGFALGSILDETAGEQFTARMIFQEVRANAWLDFERLQSHTLWLRRSSEARWNRRQQMLKLLP